MSTADAATAAATPATSDAATEKDRCVRWCFTLFGYTPEEEAYLKNEEQDENGKLNEIHEEAAYLAFQREICPTTERPHLQGAVIFHKQLRFPRVKSMLPRANLSRMRSPPFTNHKYVTKTDTREPGTEPYIWGNIPTKKDKSGARNDLNAFKHSVEVDGITDAKTLRALHSLVWAKHENWCRQFISDQIDQLTPKPITNYYPWQLDLNDRLLRNDPLEEPFDRQVHFVVDPTGNGGKSTYAADFQHKYHKKVPLGEGPTRKFPNGSERLLHVQIIEPGKKADMAKVIESSTTCLFIDITRQQIDVLQYSAIEAFKNRRVFNSKYKSEMKDVQPMHIVFLMNEHPNYRALSKDRYVVWELNANGSYLKMSQADIHRSCEEARREHEEEKELKKLDKKRKLQELRDKVES